MAITRSARSNPQETKSFACNPTLRSESRCVHGILPLPIKVWATGIFVISANCVRIREAPWRTTPFPARIIGCFASLISCAARAKQDATGSASLGKSCGTGSTLTSIFATSSGKSMCVAPGFSAVATLKALLTDSGMISGRWRSVFHFVIGLKTETTSIY